MARSVGSILCAPVLACLTSNSTFKQVTAALLSFALRDRRSDKSVPGWIDASNTGAFDIPSWTCPSSTHVERTLAHPMRPSRDPTLDTVAILSTAHQEHVDRREAHYRELALKRRYAEVDEWVSKAMTHTKPRRTWRRRRDPNRSTVTPRWQELLDGLVCREDEDWEWLVTVESWYEGVGEIRARELEERGGCLASPEHGKVFGYLGKVSSLSPIAYTPVSWDGHPSHPPFEWVERIYAPLTYEAQWLLLDALLEIPPEAAVGQLSSSMALVAGFPVLSEDRVLSTLRHVGPVMPVVHVGMEDVGWLIELPAAVQRRWDEQGPAWWTTWGVEADESPFYDQVGYRLATYFESRQSAVVGNQLALISHVDQSVQDMYYARSAALWMQEVLEGVQHRVLQEPVADNGGLGSGRVPAGMQTRKDGSLSRVLCEASCGPDAVEEPVVSCSFDGAALKWGDVYRRRDLKRVRFRRKNPGTILLEGVARCLVATTALGVRSVAGFAASGPFRLTAERVMEAIDQAGRVDRSEWENVPMDVKWLVASAYADDPDRAHDSAAALKRAGVEAKSGPREVLGSQALTTALGWILGAGPDRVFALGAAHVQGEFDGSPRKVTAVGVLPGDSEHDQPVVVCPELFAHLALKACYRKRTYVLLRELTVAAKEWCRQRKLDDVDSLLLVPGTVAMACRLSVPEVAGLTVLDGADMSTTLESSSALASGQPLVMPKGSWAGMIAGRRSSGFLWWRRWTGRHTAAHALPQQ